MSAEGGTNETRRELPLPLDRAPWALGVPLSLRLIACVFILIGVLSVAEMALQLVVFGRVSIDVLGPVWILTGRGLLRWRERWRQWAVFVTWLVLVGMIVGIGVTLWDLCFGVRGLRYSRIGSIMPGPRAALIGEMLIAAYSYWQQRVLRRWDIVDRFRSPPSAPARRRWQFSLGSLLVAVTFAAFLVARVCSDDVKYKVEHHGPTFLGKPDRTIVGWTYGTRTGRYSNHPPELLYVILHGNSPPIRMWSSSSGESGIQRADGTEIDFSRESQLFEVVGEEIVPREGRVSYEEFQDFIRQAAERPDWSIAGLLEHARRLHEKREAKTAQ